MGSAKIKILLYSTVVSFTIKAMSAILIFLIIIRPFISGLAYPPLDLVFTGISAIGLIIFLAVTKPNLQHLNKLAYPFGFFIAGLSLSLVGSIDTATSIIEIYRMIPCLLVFISAACLDESEQKTMVFALLCSAMVICFSAVYQRLFGFGFLNSYFTAAHTASPVALNYLSAKRVFFPFVTPNVLGGFCGLVIPLAFLEKRFYWTAIPLGAVLLLTQSLGALLALLLGAYLCMLLMPSKLTPWRITLTTGVLALLAAIFWFRISGQSMETTAPGLLRLSYWRNTFAVIRTHPFFGVGIGNMHLQASMYTHNSFLQLWAETGLLGAVGFIWVCVAVLQAALRRYYAAKDLLTALVICSCLTFLVHNLFDFTFFLPEVSFLWWGLMGLLLAAGRKSLPVTGLSTY